MAIFWGFMGKQSKINNHTRQEFLATFFDQHSHYEEKEVNGFWLVQQMANGETPIIAIYPQEKFKSYKAYRDKESALGTATEANLPHPIQVRAKQAVSRLF